MKGKGGEKGGGEMGKKRLQLHIYNTGNVNCLPPDCIPHSACAACSV